MAEILVCSSQKLAAGNKLHADKPIKYYKDFKELICELFQKGNNEYDHSMCTIIVIDSQESTSAKASQLQQLSYDDKALLLKYYFSQLNLVVIDNSIFSSDNSKTSQLHIASINETIDKINALVSDRITRVRTWTGTGMHCVNDQYQEINHIISTMSFTLSSTINKSSSTTDKIIKLKDMIMQEIDFKSLLSNNEISHLLKLCNLVGHWSFPAHELSNDDLIYCVYLILKYCLDQIDDNDYPGLKLSPNELLGLVFMVRDTYKNGNPFHNFRHAVDVLQACFHYVIRLGYLPSFTQFQADPKANELICLKSKKFGNAIELIPMTKITNSQNETTTTLNLIQTLALLLAALGHDVGHPGVTNAFMIKHSSPTSLLYNERSVLELFHTSIFINKILVVNWPQLLSIITDDVSKILVKDLIITSILATDMAEHFEYIDKLTHFKYDNKSNHNFHNNVNNTSVSGRQIKLISSLLIKCADISNVTRPLRVSSQWALVLSREFDEVNKLEETLGNCDKKFLTSYERVPTELTDVLLVNANLHNGQIFFINTFAENLFNNIVELLPQLKFTGEIVQENKEFWLSQTKH